ncbi:MAG TPA: hypothetical protein VMV32_05435 [Ignavibacteriaceae bacterium]|nr:hypothetical protein [Ignavibacteriaceae bacterium]
MNIQKLFIKKLERKDFFISAGVSLAGLFLIRMFPFNMLLKGKYKSKEKPFKAIVRINPLAISRNKLGDNNG